MTLTPAGHYAEAESFLAFADGIGGGTKSRSEGRSYELAVLRAQVHATLATVPRAIADAAAHPEAHRPGMVNVARPGDPPEYLSTEVTP